MPGQAYLIELRDTLATLFDTEAECRILAKEAGLNIARIAFSPKMQITWFSILEEAEKQGQIAQVIEVARQYYPQNPTLERLQQSSIYPVTTRSITNDNFAWKSTQPLTTFEKVMGVQETFLPISWLEVGMQRSRSVARIKLHNGIAGTGCLIAQNFLLTNNHILPDHDLAGQALIQFNYQKDANGIDYEPVNFHLEPTSGFHTSILNDWTLVRIKGDANAVWGALPLKSTTVNLNDYANIIQHPAGEDKKLACYHNIITYVDETRVQYLTDTLPGSSGSAVFDSQWNFIALHHAGGLLEVPTTKRRMYRNEGIHINCILHDLAGIL